jgi:hypothetical protein
MTTLGKKSRIRSTMKITIMSTQHRCDLNPNHTDSRALNPLHNRSVHRTPALIRSDCRVFLCLRNQPHAQPAMIAVPAVNKVGGSGTTVSTCEIPYIRSSRKLGIATPSTQSLFVLPELPMVTPKKSPRGWPESSPAVFVPVSTARCCSNLSDRSSSIGFSIEPDHSPVLVVLVVTNVPSAR